MGQTQRKNSLTFFTTKDCFSVISYQKLFSTIQIKSAQAKVSKAKSVIINQISVLSLFDYNRTLIVMIELTLCPSFCAQKLYLASLIFDSRETFA
ncbi:MAG: hypothetical protein DRR16_12605 [Candidatus Parabeggiatoa sp. nov. 3]|nr:MAG: hypothetical protein DRR00_15170 [Gammaproteobacteria bacterium]RKZ62189.1 MAG: hypothetical protein DRQ99_19180 [Gammaproteobacteria bacterium]RKZ85218.1 MAG: hypothetical protein DRR16_12605 [Gammaproteobacteria bacterium]